MNGDKFLSDLPEIVLKSQQPSDASSGKISPILVNYFQWHIWCFKIHTIKARWLTTRHRWNFFKMTHAGPLFFYSRIGSYRENGNHEYTIIVKEREKDDEKLRQNVKIDWNIYRGSDIASCVCNGTQMKIDQVNDLLHISVLVIQQKDSILKIEIVN